MPQIRIAICFGRHGGTHAHAYTTTILRGEGVGSEEGANGRGGKGLQSMEEVEEVGMGRSLQSIIYRFMMELICERPKQTNWRNG